MLKKTVILLAAVFAIIFLLELAKEFSHEESFAKAKGGNMELKSVFLNNDKIPSKYTCDGDDIGPELTVSGTPEKAKSLVLIVDDPDAPMGIFTHYVLFNVSPDTTKIFPSNPPKGAIEGMNDFGKQGYGGPCPPLGIHRYFFRIYALDTTLNLPSGARKPKVKEAMHGHVLDDAQLIGLYARAKQ